MTTREAAIVTIYTGILIGSFEEAQRYAEEVHGAPIFTHQFASKPFLKYLKKRAKKDFVSIEVKK
jgi:hypothetical protein